MKRQRLAIVSTHPIQYYSPWYRYLATLPELDVTVYYGHRQTAEGQAKAGFGVAFEWDVPLLDGYRHIFLTNVARVPSTDTYGGCDTPEIARLLETERYDAVLVHGWYTKSYMQAIRACWRTGTPVIVRGDSHLLTPRSRLKRWLKELYYRRFIPRFDGYLVVGERTRQYYLHYGADPAKMEFSPHFVDNERFFRASADLVHSRDQLRAQWGCQPSQLLALFVGKWIPKKRPLDFVDALARLTTHDSICGLMVGDGALRTEIETRVSKHGSRIRLAGFLNQAEIVSAYVAADLLVLPSDGGETWGLVVNEAMACGRPAIVSDAVGCAPDLVLEGSTGFTYHCGDVAALANCIASITVEKAQLLGQAARRHVERYSMQEATLGLLRCLERFQGQSVKSSHMAVNDV